MAITVTNTGYIKRTAISTYRAQRRGGKGRIGMRTRRGFRQSPLHRLDPLLHHDLLGSRPRLLAASPRDPGRRPGRKGKAIANLVAMEAGEKIAALLAVKEFPEQEEQQFVVMGSRKGVIKKTDLSAFRNPRAGGIIAMGIEEGDAVIAVEISDGKEQIFLGTRDGMAIRFEETDVRADGTHRIWRARHLAARRRRSGGDGSRARGRHAAHRGAERLRQANRARRIPSPVARRRRHHQHSDLRPEWQGRWHRLRAR